MARKITYSTEMLYNFRQLSQVAPQKKVQTLETHDGRSLLFSIGEDGGLYMTEQVNGLTAGWKQSNIAGTISNQFANQEFTVKDFCAAQNLQNDQLSLAIVVQINGKDQLFVSNVSTLKGLAQFHDGPTWTPLAFDDPNQLHIQPNIENLYVAQAKDGQYLVADISQEEFIPSSPFIKRYYIEQTPKVGSHWKAMVVGGDLEPGAISNLGRRKGELVEGIFTLGTIHGKTELLYSPLYNPFNPEAAPTITRLKVPKGATAITVVQNEQHESSLFVAAEGSLYYFSPDNLKEGAQGELILSNELFQGVKNLIGYFSENKYVVWGLNRAKELFYTQASVDQSLNCNSWSVPIPIYHNINHIAPYVTQKDASKAFFYTEDDKFYKHAQSPITGLWDSQQVYVETAIQDKARQFYSYSTLVQLLDDGKTINQESNLSIKASTNCAVYINGSYYELSEDAISVSSNSKGMLRIVQQIDDVSGAQLYIDDHAGNTVLINPMDKPFQKIALLNTEQELRNATIKNIDDSSESLIAAEISSDDLKILASTNSLLAEAYKTMSDEHYVMHRLNTKVRSSDLLLNQSNTVYLEGYGQTILCELGDIFNWLKSGINYIIDVVKDAIAGVWRLVIRIAGKVYQGVLDCIEKVTAALQWIYEAVKTGVTKLLKFLQFLFAIKDIKVTKAVFKHLSKLFLVEQVDQIKQVKVSFDSQMREFINRIKDWGGIADWSALGEAAHAKLDNNAKANLEVSAPGDLLLSHFEEHIQNIKIVSFQELKTPIGAQDLMDILFEALKREGQVLDQGLVEIQELIHDYANLTLAEALKRILSILGSTILESTQVIIDALFDLLIYFMNFAIDALDTEIHIPVVSDILNYFNIPNASILDILGWITAIPTTILYKTINQHAPFSDDQDTQRILKASTFKEVEALFSNTQQVSSLLFSPKQTTLQAVHIKENQEQVYFVNPAMLYTSNLPSSILSPRFVGNIFICGKISCGILGILKAITGAGEAFFLSTCNPFSMIYGGISTLHSGIGAVTNILAPQNPLKHPIMKAISYTASGLDILNSIIFLEKFQAFFAAPANIMKSLISQDGRGTKSIISAILCIPALAVSSYHFFELSKIPASKSRSNAIIEETSCLTNYIAKIAYAVAVNTEEPLTKTIAIASFSTSTVVTSGLHIAESIIGYDHS